MINVEELKKYKELLDNGIISQEEFDEKKNELLSSDMSTENVSGLNDGAVVSDMKSGIKKKPLIIGIVAGVAVIAAVLVVVLLVKGNKKDFKKMYGDLAKESWCTIASDGSTMKIDTNPLDVDDYVVVTAYYKIMSINKELGFPTSLNSKMGETRAIDGRQTESTDDYEVSWTYHPNHGMEVIYSVK